MSVRLRALNEAATPGPWRSGPFDTGRPRGVCAWVFGPPDLVLDRVADCGADTDEGRADAALIVALCNARDEIAAEHEAHANLLEVAERMRGGDESLTPEEWYAARDASRVAVAAVEARLA